MSLSSFFALLSAAPQIIGLVDQAVVSVEQSLGGLPGGQKLDAAVTKVHGWLAAAGNDVSAVAEVQPVVASLVNTSVAAFNAAKAFSHKAPATP